MESTFKNFLNQKAKKKKEMINYNDGKLPLAMIANNY